MSEQMLEYMSGHIPGPKPDHMSDVMAGNISELMRTRTSGHSPQHFPAFMIDDVSEHKPDLMPEQVSDMIVSMLHVRQRFSGLSQCMSLAFFQVDYSPDGGWIAKQIIYI